MRLRGHTKKYRKILQDELEKLEILEETQALPSGLLDRKSFIQAELLKLLEEEETYWHKRSSLNWLLKGDNNTDFFHRIANGKKRKNTIFCLQNENEQIEGDEKILEHATQYYKDLFGPSDSPNIQMDPGCWAPEETVDNHENEQLIRAFSEEEVKAVIMSMEKNTAPGPDHIPIEFFQACWNIIKEDIMNLFTEFYDQNLDMERLNYGQITLIPKTGDANRIQQYRPICLLDVVYKIITKTLMTRLESVLERIINKSQTAFIKKKGISWMA